MLRVLYTRVATEGSNHCACAVLDVIRGDLEAAELEPRELVFLSTVTALFDYLGMDGEARARQLNKLTVAHDVNARDVVQTRRVWGEHSVELPPEVQQLLDEMFVPERTRPSRRKRSREASPAPTAEHGMNWFGRVIATLSVDPVRAEVALRRLDADRQLANWSNASRKLKKLYYEQAAGAESGDCILYCWQEF